MSGIPPDIYPRLRRALLDCGPFGDDGQLRAVFAHEKLGPWRHSVPQASNRADRVDATIAFLVEKRRADTQENALVLLMQVLSERLDPAHACHPRLTALAEELERTTSPGLAQAIPRQPDQSTPRHAAAEEGREEPPEVVHKDFFVSYNGADQGWAEWIAWQLEAAGYTTVIQAWDFRPGGNFAIHMQLATSQARRTVAVLSPKYLQAVYTQPEWAAAFAQDPMGEEGTLLPVRVRECELKGLLAQIVYIDLVGLGEEAAKEALLAGVKQGRVKPTIAPGFPGTTKCITSEPPGFPGESSLDQGQS